MSIYIRNIAICIISLTLVACGTDTSSGEQSSSSSESTTSGTTTDDVVITSNGGSSTGGGNSSGGAEGQSQPKFSLRITDAPVDDVVKVVLTFTAVDMRTENDSDSVKFTYKNTQEIDLMSLQGTKTASLLDKVPLVSNEYKEIRLLVDDASMANFVEFENGGVQELKIPGGSSSGLKIKGDVSVSSNRDSAFTIDFDLRQSLVTAGNSGKVLLKPVVRLIDDSDMGHISGSVDSSLLVDAGCSDSNVDTFNSVYVYSGHDVIPGDINQSSEKSNAPISTSIIKYDSDSDKYLYEAAFLPAGDYTLALTCNADAENLEADDDLKFFSIKNVVVLVNNTTFL